MKSVVRVLGVGLLVLAGAANSPAQSPVPPPPPQAHNPIDGSPTVLRPYVRRSTGVSDQLIFERAVVRARERDARMEWRRWNGVSAARPQVTDGHYSNDLNRYLWYPAPGYYYALPTAGRAPSLPY